MAQHIISVQKEIEKLDAYLNTKKVRKILLVCGNSIQRLAINHYFNHLYHRLGIQVIRFSDFTPNPAYGSVVTGAAVFRQEACDAIIAVGGGSAIDVAKCIKLFAYMPPDRMYLREKITANDIPFAVMPTTAGTGSEATHFAVIYYNGEKQSVAHESCIPEVVLFDGSVLEHLPLYHKKAALADALCHSIEAYWSKQGTAESRAYAAEAIGIIVQNMQEYLSGNHSCNEKMLYAAHLAGKAINIAKTTAGHAMSYKLTSLYHLAHGHAVLLTLPKVWNCLDKNADEILRERLQELAELLECQTSAEAVQFLESLIEKLQFTFNGNVSAEEITILVDSVNVERLKNTPVSLDKAALKELYKKILMK